MKLKFRLGNLDLSQVRRAVQTLRLSTVPRSARWELMCLALGKRLLPARDYRLHLGGGQVYFAKDSLTFDQRVFDEIFLERCYDANYRDAVVVDIGAHKGYYGAYALLHGAQTVFSYEPEPHNFSFLKRSAESFRANGFQWQINQVAVGSHEGAVDLRLSDESWAHSVVAPSGSGQVGLVKVSLVSMQRILAEAGFSPGRRLLVKVDAEGAEGNIVLGTPIALWRAVDEIFVEVHSFAPCSAAEISHHLQAAGLAPQTNAVGEVVHLKRPARAEAGPLG